MNKRNNGVVCHSAGTSGLAAGILAILAMEGTVFGGPFIADNISPNPDTLVMFDSANPGAAMPGSPVATLAGNFVRGLDFDTPTTGYYICSSNIGTSPTGLYRYDNGASTLVSALPSTFTAEGGLTLSHDNTVLYAAWGITGNDLLYRISLPDGVFTLVGPMVLPGVTQSAFLGLAAHPVTGDLYGVDTTSDSLYLIDAATGMGTLVGPLGVAVGTIGGLDFDNATNELILGADPTNTKVYRLDIESGAATLLGVLPFGCSSFASVSERSGCGCVADVDDGSGTGTCDGGVTIEDLLYYLVRFDIGC